MFLAFQDRCKDASRNPFCIVFQCAVRKRMPYTMSLIV